MLGVGTCRSYNCVRRHNLGRSSNARAVSSPRAVSKKNGLLGRFCPWESLLHADTRTGRAPRSRGAHPTNTLHPYTKESLDENSGTQRSFDMARKPRNSSVPLHVHGLVPFML